MYATVTISNLADTTSRYAESPFPKWIIMDSLQKDIQFRTTFTATPCQNNFMALIHKASHNSPSRVLDYNEIVDYEKKSLHLNKGLNFVQINCCTQAEA